jgi:hypothetical protein
MLLKKPNLGKSNKEKSLSFAEGIMKKKAWIPGPANYSKIDHWNTMLPKNTGKFSQKPRITIAGEIYEQGKVTEKSVPSPAHYDPVAWRKASH